MTYPPGSFEEWFGREWLALLSEFFRSRPSMAFDAFAEMRYASRRESRFGYAGWELRPMSAKLEGGSVS